MANKKNGLYITLIVIFTILFFGLMIVLMVLLWGFREVSNMKSIMNPSVSERIDALELDEKISGPDNILDTLLFDDDYEEEFDDYWEFANVRRAYIKGRAADDKSDCIEIIQNYIDSTTYSGRRDAAKRYIEELTEQ